MILKVEDIPKFNYSKKISELSKTIEGYLNSDDSYADKTIETVLRKTTRIHSVHSTTAIEGNTLGLLRVKDTIDGKPVEGPFDEIAEVKGALNAYKLIDKVDITSIDCFLKIESIMMWGLVEENGFRSGDVVIAEGDSVIYRPPKASDVEDLMARLFEWCSSSGLPGYIAGAIMHYYIEAIHPFRDGNGRMGRFWHSAILRRQDRRFRMVSIENAILRHQDDYYRVLEECQADFDCTGFVEFMMELTASVFGDVKHILEPKMSALLRAMGDKPMSSAEIMKKMGLKDRAHFQSVYLGPAIGYGFVAMSDPEHPHSPTQKYRRLVF